MKIIIDSIFGIFEFLINYDYTVLILRLKVLAVVLSALFLVGIIYSLIKTTQIFKAMRAFYDRKNLPQDKNKQLAEWREIRKRGLSQEESERKFAILAADSLVENILGLAGYSGINLGERLKKIEPSDLNSIQDVWEAHKVRNRIAHEADYRLRPEDAAQALDRYEKALQELEYI